MTPDIDKIAELVAEKLEAKLPDIQIDKEAFENSEFVQKEIQFFQKVQKNSTTRLYLKGSVFFYV